YGYDWLGTSGDTVTYADAMRIATANGATVSHDANGEATFTYAGRTVYFQDAAGYKKKIDHLTAYHPRLGGFAAWRVGAEDPAIWPLVAELKYSMSSAVSPAPGDFAINSPAAVSLKAGALTTAKLGLVPINGFDGSADITVEKLDDFPGTVLLSSATVRVGVATTVTITTPANTRAGVYTLRVKMASPMVAHEQMLTISVQAAPSTATFRLDAPQRVTLARGATSQFALNVLPDSALEENPRVTARFVDPFSGSVALSATTIAASSPVGVSVTADRFAANGTYRLELTVQTTAVVRTQIVNVVVSGGKSRAVR
ncbi:MAG TPA: hypothetical protein VFN10_21460, partial [Thermoanaerobaculia bacterium]|nr:hypothetical protein [Thermoanaerobaculia bacterium]